MLTRRVLLSLLASIRFGHAFAADGVDSSPSQAVPKFDVVVAGPVASSLAYGDPIVVTATVTPREAFERSDISLMALGDLADIYAPPKDTDTSLCVVDGDSQAAENVPFVATCHLKPTTGRRFWRPSMWFIRPGPQRLVLVIPIVIDGTKTINHLQEVQVTFKAPLEAIFVGGLIGALLLALFAAVKERSDSPIQDVTIDSWGAVRTIVGSLAGWAIGLVPRVWRLFLQTVMGGICALIIILIAQSTEGMNPPISVTVQDIWGGVVIGLFSIPASRWIWSQLKPQS